MLAQITGIECFNKQDCKLWDISESNSPCSIDVYSELQTDTTVNSDGLMICGYDFWNTSEKYFLHQTDQVNDEGCATSESAMLKNSVAGSDNAKAVSACQSQMAHPNTEDENEEASSQSSVGGLDIFTTAALPGAPPTLSFGSAQDKSLFQHSASATTTVTNQETRSDSSHINGQRSFDEDIDSLLQAAESSALQTNTINLDNKDLQTNLCSPETSTNAVQVLSDCSRIDSECHFAANNIELRRSAATTQYSQLTPCTTISTGKRITSKKLAAFVYATCVICCEHNLHMLGLSLPARKAL